MITSDFQALLDRYSQGPALLRQSIACWTRTELHAHPIAGKWSAHEVVCHIADFEIINTDRIKRILAEDRPMIFNAEPDGFRTGTHYQMRKTENELQLIELLRTHTECILKGLSPE